MKNCYLLVSFLLIVSNAIAFGAKAEKLIMTVDYVRFKANGKAAVDFNFSIQSRTIQRQKGKDGKIVGWANVQLSVFDSSGIYAFEKIKVDLPSGDTSIKSQNNIIFKRKVVLSNGQYTVKVSAQDQFEMPADTLMVSFPLEINFQKDSVAASDFLFLQSYRYCKEKSDLVRNGMELVPFVSSFYTEKDNLIKNYLEVYELDGKVKEGEPIVLIYQVFMKGYRFALEEIGKTVVSKSKPNAVFIDEIDISKVPSGNYYLAMQVLDKNKNLLTSKTRYFQRSNPGYDKILAGKALANPDGVAGSFVQALSEEEARLYTASLQPISTNAESNTVVWLSKKGSLVQVQNYLLDFWKKRNRENPEQAFKAYKELVDAAEKAYSNRTFRAYETDRGRVFLQYGKPNLIENEISDRFRKALENRSTIPYEVWYYYNIKQLNQSDVIFAFVQENRGNNNYRLLHSTAVGEVRNREWRKVVENNFTTNFDWQDPNDRFDPNDRSKFR